MTEFEKLASVLTNLMGDVGQAIRSGADPVEILKALSGAAAYVLGVGVVSGAISVEKAEKLADAMNGTIKSALRKTDLFQVFTEEMPPPQA